MRSVFGAVVLFGSVAAAPTPSPTSEVYETTYPCVGWTQDGTLDKGRRERYVALEFDGSSDLFKGYNNSIWTVVLLLACF